MMHSQKLKEEIRQLAVQRDAVILAHNYQPPAIQELADYIGDSFGLALKSQQIEARTIVFAGVQFMAETAAILNPNKRVLLPDPTARCPMAAQLPVSLIKKARKKHPGIPVVLYVNTTAEAKAEADVLCTSSNMCKILASLKSQVILFGPDGNMAEYARHVCHQKVIPIPDHGFCHVHVTFTFDPEIIRLKEEYPEAKLLVHPECDWELQKQADFIGSTSQMIQYARTSPAEVLIVATEVDLVTRMRQEIPKKTILPALKYAICKAQKKITLANIKASLEFDQFPITVPDKISKQARKAIQRMIDLTNSTSEK